MTLTLEELKSALKGKQDALSRLVEEAAPVIQARVVRALKRRSSFAKGRTIRQEVEDLTQEIFASLFTADAKILRSWDPERGLSLSSFIALVADRQVVSILRTGKKNPWFEDPTLGEDLEQKAARKDIDFVSAGSPTPGTPEREVASSELLHRMVDRLRERLSPLGFRLFTLVCVEELSVREICDEMKMSENAVYAWRARLVRLAREIKLELMSENKRPARIEQMGMNAP